MSATLKLQNPRAPCFDDLQRASRAPYLCASTDDAPQTRLQSSRVPCVHACTPAARLQRSVPPYVYVFTLLHLQRVSVLRQSIPPCLHVATPTARPQTSRPSYHRATYHRATYNRASYIPPSFLIPSSFLHTDSGFATTIELCARSFEHREHHASIHTSTSLQLTADVRAPGLHTSTSPFPLPTPAAHLQSSRAPYLYTSRPNGGAVQSIGQSAGTVEMTVISMAAAASVPLRYNNLQRPCT